MSQEEVNAKLAIWIGWTRGSRFWHHPWCTEDTGCVTMCGRKEPPDFYTSEEANAMLLEKMAPKGLRLEPRITWQDYNPIVVGWHMHVFVQVGGGGMSRLDELGFDKDRKTAIVNAALALIESQQESKR